MTSTIQGHGIITKNNQQNKKILKKEKETLKTVNIQL